MITERTLKRWRREALISVKREHTPTTSPEEFSVDILHQDELNNRILRLTQELLDLYLTREAKA